MEVKWEIDDLAIGVKPGTKGRIGYVAAVSTDRGVPILALRGESWCYWADCFIKVEPLGSTQHFLFLNDLAGDQRIAKYRNSLR